MFNTVLIWHFCLGLRLLTSLQVSTHGRQSTPPPRRPSFKWLYAPSQMHRSVADGLYCSVSISQGCPQADSLLLHPDPPTCHLLPLWTAFVMSALISPTNNTAKQPVWFSIRLRWVQVAVLLTIRSMLNNTNQGNRVWCFAVIFCRDVISRYILILLVFSMDAGILESGSQPVYTHT